jgi:UDP-N-acetylglucosamine 1-carboxyvinyltransferase
MARLIIDGGRPLRGTVKLSGAKNSGFKLMIAALLANGASRLQNLSLIEEVRHVATMIEALGGKVKFLGAGRAVIDSRGLCRYQLPRQLGNFSRASTLFIGPLLARFGRAVVPLPGGDAIGRRPLERHFAALSSMGARIRIYSDRVEARTDKLTAASFKFPKNSHTGTDTMLLAAVLTAGKTIIGSAAKEPEVDDLIEFLTKMGAKIKRCGRSIEINGVSRVEAAEHTVMPDRNQAVSYAVAALASRGEVFVSQARPDHLDAFLEKLNQAGAGVAVSSQGIRFFYRGSLQAVAVTTRPHPGFMSDWQPLWSVLMTQAQGQSRIIETVFSRRFQFVPALTAMGAKIRQFDPRPQDPERFYNFNLSDDEAGGCHGLKITGPTPLFGGKFDLFDIRAGATLVIAGLIARGQTMLGRAELLDRGYEDFAGNLARLGAKIRMER